MTSERTRHEGEAKRAPLIDPEKLRRQRYAAGLNMTDLARRAGLTLSTVSGYEAGRRGASPRSLVRMAEALGCEPTDLMRDADKAAA